MSRIGAPTKRMSATARMGRVNDGIDQTPYILKQEGIISDVARPEDMKRGIIGYTARGVVTMDGLKRKTKEQYQKKIKDLEQKKKKVSPTISKVYKEAQEELSKFAEKTTKAKKLNEIIPFTRANEYVGQFVNFKVNVLNDYDTAIQNVKQEIMKSQKYQQTLADRRRGATGERKIRYTYDRRDEREYERALREQLKVLEDYKNKNINEITFGEDISYIPLKPVAEHAKQVRRANYTGRWMDRGRQAINKHRYNQAVESETKRLTESYPHITKETAKAIVEKAIKEGKMSYTVPAIDVRKDPVGWAHQVLGDKTRRWW